MFIKERNIGLFFGLLLIALCIVAYLPGYQGPWLFDDKHNIQQLPDLQPEYLTQHALWQGAKVNGEWKSRPLARLSFAVNVKFCGLNSACFKLTNISLQILAAFLAVWFFYQLFCLLESNYKKDRLTEHFLIFSFFAATLWAIHPINVSTVLYVVQRMTILATIFSLLALISYLHWRSLAWSYQAWYFPLLALLCWFAALFCKENAVILPLLIFNLELFLGAGRDNARLQKKLLLGFGLLLIVGFIAGYYQLGSSGFFETFSQREFSAWERLLTQTRVIVAYLYWIILPIESHYTLFHDDFSVSTSLMNPLSTLFSVIFLFGVSVIAIIFRRRAPLFGFAWFWFLIGHAVESSFLNLELVFEHRNHLPLLGLIFLLFFYLARIKILKSQYALAMCVVILLYCFSVTFEKSYQWRSDGSMLLAEIKHHPNSLRLNYKVGFLWLQLSETSTLEEAVQKNLVDKSRAAFQSAMQANSQSIHGLVGLLYLSGKGKISARPEYWSLLHQRLENSTISADTGTVLGVLASCQLRQICKLPHAELLKAYDLYLGRDINNSARTNAERMQQKLN